MTPRLYLDTPLRTGEAAGVGADEAHYLRAVLRRKAGDPVCVFNAQDGEYDAVIEDLGKKGGAVRIGAQLREPYAENGPILAFALVKRAAVETMIQKGVELGASAFQPIITARTNADRIRIDRLEAIAREATEQCGRLRPPSVAEPRALSALLEEREERLLIFCDEAGDEPAELWGGRAGRASPMLAAPMPAALEGGEVGPSIILIGPEGGFTPEERKALRARSDVVPVTLGPRILRADTAAIAALTLWQAAYGDLKRS